MNKKIQILLSTIIAIILIGTQVSYAVSVNQNIKFFEVSTTEISSGETLEMTFNINKIEYDNFKIVLNSNIDNGEIYTDENVAIKEEKDAIVIEIDKTKMNLSQIKLCYVVPENTEINSKIQLTTKIIVEEEIESEDDEENTSTKKKEKIVLEETQNVIVAEKEENSEKENSQNGNEEKEDKQKDSAQKDTDSIEQSDDQKSQNNEMSKVTNNTNETMSQKNNQNLAISDENMLQKNTQNSTIINAKSSDKNMSSNVVGNVSRKNNSNVADGTNNKSSVSGSNSASSMQGSSQSNEKMETATYIGSNNNYLKKLKVKGLDLNTSFNKENTTYFVNVTDKSSLKITATAEDTSAKAVVTGNDDIKEGTNKILIAVTAENGNVRYYRIFVNCELN